MRHGENENVKTSKRLQGGFEPGLPRLRVRRRPTAELPRSIIIQCGILSGGGGSTQCYDPPSLPIS